MTFAGGATGKFFCGFLSERIGIIRTVLVTEAATGLGVLLLLALPATPALFLLPVLGIALNGTSSVLYGTVARAGRAGAPLARLRPVLHHRHRRGRAGAAALRPALRRGRASRPTLTVLAAVILCTLPVAHFLRPSVEGGRPAEVE